MHMLTINIDWEYFLSIIGTEGPAKPRGSTWNGAGTCVIFSQSRQVNFSRTYCTTFHCRGTTSSVSGDILAELGEPPRAAAGAGIGTGQHDPLARQMRRERLARRPVARKAVSGRRLADSGGRLGLRRYSPPTMAPSAMSVRRDSPRHMTVLPGGGSLARAR
jgi:hypothetical protein